MQYENMNRLKGLYNKGFRCIKYEEDGQGQFTAYFKNFEEEKIDDITSSNGEEIAEMKNFIDNDLS